MFSHDIGFLLRRFKPKQNSTKIQEKKKKKKRKKTQKHKQKTKQKNCIQTC